jgi:hypothetical protein
LKKKKKTWKTMSHLDLEALEVMSAGGWARRQLGEEALRDRAFPRPLRAGGAAGDPAARGGFLGALVVDNREIGGARGHASKDNIDYSTVSASNVLFSSSFISYVHMHLYFTSCLVSLQRHWIVSNILRYCENI